MENILPLLNIPDASFETKTPRPKSAGARLTSTGLGSSRGRPAPSARRGSTHLVPSSARSTKSNKSSKRKDDSDDSDFIDDDEDEDSEEEEEEGAWVYEVESATNVQDAMHALWMNDPVVFYEHGLSIKAMLEYRLACKWQREFESEDEGTEGEDPSATRT